MLDFENRIHEILSGRKARVDAKSTQTLYFIKTLF